MSPHDLSVAAVRVPGTKKCSLDVGYLGAEAWVAECLSRTRFSLPGDRVQLLLLRSEWSRGMKCAGGSMTVFVTGATGFVGRAVVAELVRHGHLAKCLVRRTDGERADLLRRLGTVELVKGDLLVNSDVSSVVRGCDAVIHLVGIIAEVGASTFERVHVQGTRKAVQAAVSAGAKRFIHMSALGTRPNAQSTYHRTKWAAEEIVRSSGLDWTIFRPSLIHGPGDQFVNRFAKMTGWSPFVPVIGPGSHKLQPVSVQTVAHCFVAALSTPTAIGKVYDLCGDEQLTFVEVIDAILAATGRQRAKLHLPVRAATLLARLMEQVWPKLFNRAPPLARDQIVMLQEDNIGDPRPARETFGFGPEIFSADIRRYLGENSTNDRP